MRSIVCSLVLLGLVAGCKNSVAGSTWSFCDKENETVTFEPGGAATFRKDGETNAKGLACGDAKWVQAGSEVTFDCRQVTEYKVTLAGTEMRGEWHRVKGGSDNGPTCLKRLPGK